MIINPQIAIDEGWVTFPEEPLNEKQLQPNGIDLRLKIAWKIPIHKPFKLFNHKTVHLDKYRCEQSIYDDHPTLLFERGLAYSVETFEFVKIPINVAALVYGRSSLNRNGVFCRSTIYDSGFENFVGFTVYPFVPFEAHFGARIAQIIFIKADSSHLYTGQYLYRKECDPNDNSED